MENKRSKLEKASPSPFIGSIDEDDCIILIDLDKKTGWLLTQRLRE